MPLAWSSHRPNMGYMDKRKLRDRQMGIGTSECPDVVEMSDDTYEDERLADVAEDVDVSGPPPLFGPLDDDEFEWADD